MGKNNKDKPIEWAVLAVGVAFICLGIVGPLVLYYFEYTSDNVWRLDSWQPYVGIICIVVYFTLIKAAIDIRKDDDET